MNDVEIIKQIENVIDPTFLKLSSLQLQENSAAYNSIVIKSPTTLYRSGNNGNKSVLFCRIKTSGNVQYIAFSSKYQTYFENLGIEATTIKSEIDFIRINIDDFIQALPKIQTLLNKIFVDSFSFETFGCCSLYKKCSAEGKCLHQDILYATACMYRKNLERGNIFY